MNISRKFSIFIIPCIIIALSAVSFGKDDKKKDEKRHTKAEVEGLVQKVADKLNAIKNLEESEVVRFEISKIEDHINSTKKLIADGKIEQAYYEISIGIIYFPMIDAHLDKYKAEQELEKTIKKYSK